jgi:hypothetical protein
MALVLILIKFWLFITIIALRFKHCGLYFMVIKIFTWSK